MHRVRPPAQVGLFISTWQDVFNYIVFSSKLYMLFDKVLVLSRGRMVYNGAGGLVPAEYFASRGYPPQPGYNVADHLLDIASEPTDDLLADSRTFSVPVSRTGTGSDDGAIPAEKKTDSLPQDEEATEPNLLKEKRSPLKSRMPHRSNYPSTFLTQFQVLCGREWKILRRPVSVWCVVS